MAMNMSMIAAQVRKDFFDPIASFIARSPIYSYWRELENSQYLPETTLLEFQWQRLRSHLGYVYEKNEFYRKRFKKAGIHPDDINSRHDIMKLPILTKEEIRRNQGEMISSGFKPENLLKFKTGGSTGKALEIYITEECSELRNACARRHDRWSGWEVGEPIGAIWGNPEIPKDFKSKLRSSLLRPTIYLDTMSLDADSVREFSRQWAKAKPTLLFGHAHSIYILAAYVAELGIDSIKPRGIITTSMMLLPHERKVIEKVFELKVFDRYGCEEVSLIGSECEEHVGMHMNIEHLFIEFVRDDGSWCANGEPGRIIVTDLMNKAMPMIRYQVEDVAAPSARKCSCGRGLPLMEKVTGRVADFLVKRNGTRVAGVSLIENTLTKIPGIQQLQIIQENIDLIVLNVVPGPTFDESSSSALCGYFRDLFLGLAEVKIVVVKDILPESSGKYRFSICKIPSRDQPLRAN